MPTHGVDIDHNPSVITDALESGDMLRVKKGDVRVHKKIFDYTSTISPPFDSSVTELVDIVFTVPTFVVQRSGMICCCIENTVVSVTAYD